MAWKSSFRQNYRITFSPTVPASAAWISHVVADVEAPGGEKWEDIKSGGKQWQATHKNLPRMQRTRAIPVTWLNSGLCPEWPKGWIPIIIIIIIIIIISREKVQLDAQSNTHQIFWMLPLPPHLILMFNTEVLTLQWYWEFKFQLLPGIKGF